MATDWAALYDCFADEVGDWPGPAYRLARLDPAGDYAPGNVVWRLRGDCRDTVSHRVLTATARALACELGRQAGPRVPTLTA